MHRLAFWLVVPSVSSKAGRDGVLLGQWESGHRSNREKFLLYQLRIISIGLVPTVRHATATRGCEGPRFV